MFLVDGDVEPRIETTLNSSIRVFQIKDVRMNILYRTVVYEHKGRPGGKLLDDPQHLANSIEICLQRPIN